MHDQPNASARVCANCDGFASVAVSSGLGRDAHGHLHTLTLDCTACHGTGTRPTRDTVRPVALTGAAR
ncbi:hypothetical protein [Streptomyces fractus]|uniref:hypothetical protein n=1 Tax=Streptomyces fractus TaxID=641806 RepID=UPI003CF9E73E